MSLIINKTAGLSAVAVLLLASSLSVQAAPESATVNITASVVDNTCTPDWDAAGVSVPMGSAHVSDFNQKGDVALTKEFDLKLKDCGDASTKVKVTANGTGDTDDTSAFVNQTDVDGGGASGVAITIFGGEKQDTQLLPDGSASTEYAIADSAADMKFLAKLEMSGAKAVTTGDVKSVVNMTIDYE